MIEGTAVGQYRIIRKIGEGGMGAVYLAEHVMIGRRAAIKVLLPQLSQQREIVDRFFNEARATTAIPDPGIVQVFDFGVHHDGSAYIVMEFLEGEPIDARLRRNGRIPPFEALRIVRQAAGSLASAHARGIVHRDLKPENIFLVPDPEAQGGERPKVLDFGIAKLGGDNPAGSRTRTGALMGTPVYMSPEQCRGAGLVDHRSDIYSLGCVLFHMLTGRPPFEADGVGEIIASHLREPAPPPSSVVEGLPPGVDELVLATLAKAPEQRIQTMPELQVACDRLMARITATGANAPTVAIATPLAPGFRSEYPGASSTPIPGSIPPAAASLPPAPTTLSAAAGQAGGTLPPPRRSRTALLVAGILVVGGAIGGAIALLRQPAEKTGDTGAADRQPEPEPTPDPTPDPAGAADAAVAAVPVDAGVVTDATVTAVAEPVFTPDAGTSTAAADQPDKPSDKPSSKKAGKKAGKKGSGKGSSTNDGTDLYDSR